MKLTHTFAAMGLLFACAITGASAQKSSTVILTPDKAGVPISNVTATLESDFNESQPLDKAMAPFAHLPLHWKITQEQFNEYSNGDHPTFIEITASSGDLKQVAYYNAKGDLVRFIETGMNLPLNDKILQSINSSYPDWQITGNKSHFDSEKRNADYYKVMLSKGKERKAAYFSMEGIEINHHLRPIK